MTFVYRAGSSVFVMLLFAALSMGAASAQSCPSDTLLFSGQQSQSGFTYGGNEGWVQLNQAPTLDYLRQHVAAWIGVVGASSVQQPCFNGDNSLNDHCWQQAGITKGTGSSGPLIIRTNVPVIYFESSSAGPYQLVKYGQTSPPSHKFFNAYFSGGWQNGKAIWNSYESPETFNPVLIGQSLQWQPTMLAATKTEIYTGYYPGGTQATCPTFGTISYGSNSANQASTTFGLQNTPVPANWWTLWTGPIDPSVDSPYFRNDYGNKYWFFQSGGGQ